jgi:hypothetical protein
LLLSFLEAVKIARAHDAVMVLLRAEYVQETYTLCRLIHEAGEDIWFMATPLGEGGKPSEDQHHFLNELFTGRQDPQPTSPAYQQPSRNRQQHV